MSRPILKYNVADARKFNEAEVRFHIIDPIMRELGYPGDGNVYIKLEEKLDYPYYYIGRKNKKRDVPIGYPDYRAGILGARGSFIVEAKGADVGVSKADVEQAHSYAAHAEVGAHFFVLCDGIEFRIYETLSGANANPLVVLNVAEIEARFHEIENLLSPPKLSRICQISYDLNLKLADGLKSSVEIRDGSYGMSHWEYRVFVRDVDMTEKFKPAFIQLDEQLNVLQSSFELRVGDGIIRRGEDGRIDAVVDFIGATKNNDTAMKLIGLNRMVFATNDEFLSKNPDSPTIFESTSDLQVAKGTKLPPMFGDAIQMDLDVRMEVYVKTRMFLSEDGPKGDYLAIADYYTDFPGFGPVRFEFDFSGVTNLRLIRS